MVLTLLVSGMSLAQTDSLRLEVEGDKAFVIHRVLAKQTLYSLARRYKTTIDAIKQENPTLANGLQKGQTLRIPFGGDITAQPQSAAAQEVSYTSITHRVVAGETLFSIAKLYNVSVPDLKNWNNLESNTISLNQELMVQQPEGASQNGSMQQPLNTETVEIEAVSIIMHTVQPEETLFAISRRYQVSVNDIKSWNRLNSNALALGQKLEIRLDPGKVEALGNDVNSGSEAEGDSASTVSEKTIEYEGTPFQQYEIEGVAEVIEEEEPSTKFFALHRTAKEGTVIKVTNLMNNQTVYVRVVGSIPETDTNEDVIIKLNQRAYDNLKAIDKRFRVRLSYFQ